MEEGRREEIGRRGWAGGRWKLQSRMKEERGGEGRGKESTKKVAGGSRRGEGRRECGVLKGARKREKREEGQGRERRAMTEDT